MPWNNAQELNDDGRNYGLMVVIAMVVGERLRTVVTNPLDNSEILQPTSSNTHATT